MVRSIRVYTVTLFEAVEVKTLLYASSAYVCLCLIMVNSMYLIVSLQP